MQCRAGYNRGMEQEKKSKLLAGLMRYVDQDAASVHLEIPLSKSNPESAFKILRTHVSKYAGSLQAGSAFLYKFHESKGAEPVLTSIQLTLKDLVTMTAYFTKHAEDPTIPDAARQLFVDILGSIQRNPRVVKAEWKMSSAYDNIVNDVREILHLDAQHQGDFNIIPRQHVDGSTGRYFVPHAISNIEDFRAVQMLRAEMPEHKNVKNSTSQSGVLALQNIMHFNVDSFSQGHAAAGARTHLARLTETFGPFGDDGPTRGGSSRRIA